MMNAEIIAIGSELLLGVTVDTNSAYLARHLADLGIPLLRVSLVDDRRERITAAIEEALNRADLVICTGGLGPTLDDMTREAAAQALGRPLEFRQDLLDQIAARFAAMQRPMSDTNRLQAYVPQGGRALENTQGTAPAFLVEGENGQGTLIALPGVPREMQTLFTTAVLPYLRDECGASGTMVVRTLYVAGMGESMIGEQIVDLMRLDNPTVGTSARQGQCELRLVARGETRAAAEALIAPVETALRERLGSALVGDEPLEQQVVQLLARHHCSLAIYEGNPMAPLYRALSALPDGLAPVCGVIIRSPTPSADASSVAPLAHAGAYSAMANYACTLGVGIQVAAKTDEDGFTSVCVALAFRGGDRFVKQSADLRHPQGWEYVANLALDAVRRYLVEEHEGEG
jgi:competence/damage-inducible protein CinA-like protein